MINPNGRFLYTASILLLIILPACSDMKAYFPDKHKDYQYSQESSALNLPSDLDDITIIDPIEDDVALEKAQKERLQSQIGAQLGRVQLVTYRNGATRLMIQEPYERSWYIIGKALSRSSLEVTERNQDEGSYIVHFDPQEREIQDGTLWQEVIFFFGEDQHVEQEFHLKIAENGEYTELIVMDKNNTPLAKGPGLSLLIVLFDAIKTDIAGSG